MSYFVCVCVPQDYSLQAQSNLFFLSILKEPCEEFSQLKPNQVAPKMQHIVSLIRIIWVKSNYYNTSEKITGLFHKVCNLIEKSNVGQCMQTSFLLIRSVCTSFTQVHAPFFILYLHRHSAIRSSHSHLTQLLHNQSCSQQKCLWSNFNIYNIHR